MHNISIAQALDVWSDLEQAHLGKNGFGGHTAEIYAYRLKPHNPTALVKGESFSDFNREWQEDATASFVALLLLFEDRRSCRINIDDMGIRQWEKENRAFSHCARVTVIPEGKS